MGVDWDHNAWYHRRLLRELPEHVGRVLDVGCGAGALAVTLVDRAERVDAIDRSAEMIERARSRVPSTVHCEVADVVTADLGHERYDAVVSVSVLHHLDLAVVLPRLAGVLAPGGVLVAVALPRVDLPHDVPVEVLAVTAHRLLGTAFRVQAVTAGPGRFTREPDHDLMPMAGPTLTTREVRARATALLPGARVRRLVLWRYLLVWRKPV